MDPAILNPLLISILCAFTGSLIVLRSISPLARKFGLVDDPDERKRHTGSIPITGGIAITVGALGAFFVFQQLNTATATATTIRSYILLGGTLMLILGIIDDLNHCSWRKRLLGQIVISAATLKLTGLSVHTIVGFDLTSIPGLSFGFTLLAIIGLTNAFNLIDGIDGLAGSIALIAIADLFVFSAPNVVLADSADLVLIAAALLPYLYANAFGRKEAKVFLGDSGSYMLGFVIAMNLINSSQGANPTLSTS
jgi:UDP-GlcNAc:undecaprenyl-phosphate GlcNAc-1-phosphate transferase